MNYFSKLRAALALACIVAAGAHAFGDPIPGGRCETAAARVTPKHR